MVPNKYQKVVNKKFEFSFCIWHIRPSRAPPVIPSREGQGKVQGGGITGFVT